MPPTIYDQIEEAAEARRAEIAAHIAAHEAEQDERAETAAQNLVAVIEDVFGMTGTNWAHVRRPNGEVVVTIVELEHTIRVGCCYHDWSPSAPCPTSQPMDGPWFVRGCQGLSTCIEDVPTRISDWTSAAGWGTAWAIEPTHDAGEHLEPF